MTSRRTLSRIIDKEFSKNVRAVSIILSNRSELAKAVNNEKEVKEKYIYIYIYIYIYMYIYACTQYSSVKIYGSIKDANKPNEICIVQGQAWHSRS